MIMWDKGLKQNLLLLNVKLDLLKVLNAVNLCHPFEPHKPMLYLLSTRCVLMLALLFNTLENPGSVTDDEASESAEKC